MKEEEHSTANEDLSTIDPEDHEERMREQRGIMDRLYGLADRILKVTESNMELTSEIKAEMDALPQNQKDALATILVLAAQGSALKRKELAETKFVVELARRSAKELEETRAAAIKELKAKPKLTKTQAEYLKELHKAEKDEMFGWDANHNMEHASVNVDKLTLTDFAIVNILYGKELLARSVKKKGLPWLAKGDALGAFYAFKSIVEIDSSDCYKFFEPSEKDTPIPKALVEEATRLANIIARAWTRGQAMDYLDNKMHGRACDFGFRDTMKNAGIERFSLEGFEAFIFGKNMNENQPSEIVNADHAVECLAETGEPEDIPVLSVIHEMCWEGCMEGYCSSAEHAILSRAIASVAVESVKSDIYALGISYDVDIKTLVRNVGIMIDSLGYSELFFTFGGLSDFAELPQNPTDREIALIKIKAAKEEQLDQKLTKELDPTVKNRFTRAVMEFGIKYGLLEEASNESGPYAECKLTEKGKQLITLVLKQAPRLEIKHSDDGMVTIIHHVNPKQEAPQLPLPSLREGPTASTAKEPLRSKS